MGVSSNFWKVPCAKTLSSLSCFSLFSIVPILPFSVFVKWIRLFIHTYWFSQLVNKVNYVRKDVVLMFCFPHSYKILHYAWHRMLPSIHFFLIWSFYFPLDFINNLWAAFSYKNVERCFSVLTVCAQLRFYFSGNNKFAKKSCIVACKMC